jgi:hypothetical protein
LKAIAEMQASADSNKTCNRFNITQPIFQSIDAFVTNFQLILIVDSFQLKQEFVQLPTILRELNNDLFHPPFTENLSS